MTSGQVQRLRGVDMKAPEAVESPAETENAEEAEESAEAAVPEGDDS
jgi:hypothetical protein